jgi:hypothetical protein
VRIAASGLAGVATTAVVDRSPDGTRWTTVRGGAPAAVFGGALALDDYEWPSGVELTYRVRSYTSGGYLDVVTGTITASLVDEVWLKFPARPFLNRRVTVTDYGPITRAARAGVFDIVGRNLPVAVTDVRGSRRCELELMSITSAEADDLDLALASGDVIFLHTPAGCPVPGMYAVAGELTQARRSHRGVRRYTTLPLTETAAPAPEVVGPAATCQTLVNLYATCANVVDAFATCADLLAELVGDTSEVIVA